MSDSEHRDLWETYWQRPDSAEPFAQLVSAWMPLVRHAIERLSIRLPTHVQREDLLQCAVMGLCHAIEHYDRNHPAPFAAFAMPRIRGAILDELRHNDPLTRNVRARWRAVEETAEQWTQDHGRPPAEDELAAAAGISSADLTELLDKSQPWLSLDQPWMDASGESRCLLETLRDERTAKPDTRAQKEDLLNALRAMFRKLDTREQKILYLYWFEELRLSEIAELFEISEARVCQIQSMALLKLRAMMHAIGESMS